MKHRIARRVLVASLLALFAAASARASELGDDLKARRARVMDRLGVDAMLIVWSAPEQRYSLDIDYEYRQDSNLYYLTGITQDETIVVLMSGNETHREILFVKDKNPLREHWTGRSLTRDEATAHRVRGATSWSYPSIVGSGPNATVLHYPDGGRQMQAGELLLVDAACNYEYMSGDITRTYPVGGTFSAAQKDIYQIVLQAQDEGAAAAHAGATLQDVHKKTVEVIKAGLLKLGLITDITGDQYRVWYTHGASHYIGIDVHDVGANTRPLEAGMAFTIEPGIYIRQSALDTLPRTPENDAFIKSVQAAVRKYADAGVRIEGSFLLEEAGLRRLSGSVPRTIDDIESFLK